MYHEQNDFIEMHDLIHNRISGSRLSEAHLQIVNVMTVMESVDKEQKGVLDGYKFLSDFCHPNYSGMLGMYGKLDKGKRYPILVNGMVILSKHLHL